jgi:hypothetical protein
VLGFDYTSTTLTHNGAKTMAFFTQAMKAERAPAITKIAKEYGIKLSMKVEHHSTFVITLNSGSLDFIGDYNKTQAANVYYNDRDYSPAEYLQLHRYSDFNKCFSDQKIAEFLTKITAVAMQGNHDNSDIMTDYHDVGFYFYIHVGKWNKHYIFNEK